MLRPLLRLLLAMPRFRGKSAVARAIGRLSGPVWLQSSYGPWMRFYPDDATSAYATVGGQGYDRVVQVLDQLTSGMNFVDIGANAGLMSLIASPRVLPDGTCFAFEPNPFVLVRLTENVIRNAARNVQIVPLALSDSTGFVPMEFDSSHTGRANIAAGSEESLRVLAVDLRSSFESLLLEISSRPFIVKIDVEGHEEYALRSIERLLCSENCRVIVVEIEEDFMIRSGSSRDTVLSQIMAHGFKPAPSGGLQDHYDQVFYR